MIADDPRFENVEKDSMTHCCFKLVSAEDGENHEIMNALLKEGISIEYHKDYFKAVAVNSDIDEESFGSILERIFAAHERLNQK